jgi:hypothetical protein
MIGPTDRQLIGWMFAFCLLGLALIWLALSACSYPPVLKIEVHSPPAASADADAGGD